MDKERKGRREASDGTGPKEKLRQFADDYRKWVASMTKKQRIRLRILQCILVLALVGGGVCGALASWISTPDVPKPVDKQGTDVGDSSDGGQSSTTFDGAEIPDVALSGRKDGVYTFLVAGQDTNSSNIDTIMLATYDTVNKTMNIMNIPRDTMVNVSWSTKKINSVYAANMGSDKATQTQNGTDALKRHIANLTGITPDFYVFVEWDAVGELVDAIGGVTFDVPFDLKYDDPYQNLHINQAAGERELTGDDAMQVVRWRQNNDHSHSAQGDIGRIEMQQNFLRAVAAECLQAKTLLKAPALVQVFLDNVKTDLTIGNLLAFAQLAIGMDADEGVQFITMPYVSFYRYGSYVLPVQDEILTLVNESFNPYLRDITAKDLQLMYSKGNGAVGVTNAALLDPSVGNIVVTKTEETPKTEPQNQGDGAADAQTPGDADTKTDTTGTDGSTSATGDQSQPDIFPPVTGDADTSNNPQTGDGAQDPDVLEPPANAVPPGLGTASGDASQSDQGSTDITNNAPPLSGSAPDQQTENDAAVQVLQPPTALNPAA